MSIILTAKQIRALSEMIGADDDDDTEITIFKCDKTAHSGEGIYACYTEYESEGSLKL